MVRLALPHLPVGIHETIGTIMDPPPPKKTDLKLGNLYFFLGGSIMVFQVFYIFMVFPIFLWFWVEVPKRISQSWFWDPPIVHLVQKGRSWALTFRSKEFSVEISNLTDANLLFQLITVFVVSLIKAAPLSLIFCVHIGTWGHHCDRCQIKDTSRKRLPCRRGVRRYRTPQGRSWATFLRQHLCWVAVEGFFPCFFYSSVWGFWRNQFCWRCWRLYIYIRKYGSWGRYHNIYIYTCPL